MKSKVDKKVNQRIRKLNKQLQDDVFKDRFWIRQVRKSKVDDVEYYLYELKDRVQPERDTLIGKWFSYFDILTFHNIDIEVNNFIITSDFWQKYKN